MINKKFNVPAILPGTCGFEMMKYPFFTSAVFAAILTLGVPVFAEEAAPANTAATASHAVDDVVNRYPPGTIQTVEQADQALVEIKQQRARLGEQFSEEEAACYSKFFVTACTDAVKERRRAAFGQLNPIEIEANAFKRRARVVERDKALAEQQAKDDAKALKRADSSKSGEAAQASPMPNKEEIRKMEEKASAGNNNNEPFMKTNTEREAQHKAQMEKEQAKEASEAARRAENIKDYEKKAQKSQERQRKVAERKAKREQERNKKITEAP